MTTPHPLSFPDYRCYWLSRLCAVFAQNMMIVVIGWQAYETARSVLGMSIKEASFQLGLIGLVQFLPLMLLSPVTGLVADRFDRRRVAQLAIGTDGLIALMLLVASARGFVTLPLLFLASALHGAVRGFVGPALSSLSANLIPRDVLPRAIAIGSVAWQLASILGPVLGGMLFAFAPYVPYAAAVVLIAVTLLSLELIRYRSQERVVRTESPIALLQEGFSYVWAHKMLLGCISLDLFAVLFGGATAMLPAFARDIFHVGASGLGLMRAAPGAGAVIVALILAQHPIRNNVGVIMLAAVGVFGVATALFGLSHSLWLALPCLAVLGAADGVSVFIRSTLMQLHTPDAMRGRVSAISGLFISASNELGEAESGVLSAAIGPVAAVVAGGVGAIIVTLAWGKLFPEIRAAKSFETQVKFETQAKEAVT
jgi:MFS family permease